MQTWKAKIATELRTLDGEVILVGHSLGGAALLKYLEEEKVEKRSPVCSCWLLYAKGKEAAINSVTIWRTSLMT